jgi:hypothetical protein
MTFDAMTTSPVESMNSHMKKFKKVSGRNSISRSVQIMTEGADERVDNILKKSQRKLQLSVIGSKLPDAHLFSRKCVFMLHYHFDVRKKHECAMISDHSWLVWNFEIDDKIVDNKQMHHGPTHFDGRDDAPARNCRYRPIEGVQGFTQSQWIIFLDVPIYLVKIPVRSKKNS